MARSEREEWKSYLLKAHDLRQRQPKPFSEEQISQLLSGGDSSIPEEKRVVRVFTSSTFTDTKIERNNLMADAYPYMRQLCSLLGLEFQVVDMRWGVRDERSDNHGTSALCMSEVHNCLKLSLSCSFITILGNKYGYRPFPALIELEEFTKLHHCLATHPDINLLQKWYRLDTNNIPPRYVLLPIQELLPNYRAPNKIEYNEWWSTFEKLQSMLRSAAPKCLDSLAADKYIQSVTEEEIKNGILHNPESPHTSFFFDREYINLRETTPEAGLFTDLKDKKQDMEATTLLKQLKDNIYKKLPQENCFKWTVDWMDRPVEEVFDTKLAEFVDVFCRKLATVTLKRYDELHVDNTPLIREIMHHHSIIKTKCSSFVVREDIKKQLDAYLQSSSTQPLVVHGQGGSGKTSFMAKSAADTKALFPNAIVIARFLGTSPDSSNPRSLLYSLACQIAKVYAKDESKIPVDYSELSKFECLSFATPEQPLFLFLDSLDQMVLDSKPLDVKWIPKELPPNMHLVVSTLPDVGEILHNLQHAQLLPVPTLDAKDASKIVEQLLSESHRTLSAEQMKKVLSYVAECPLPLYIRLLSDICAGLPCYKPVPDLPTTIKGLIGVILQSVERNHGKVIVSHALSYITSARSGLTLNELEDVLACDDEVIDDVYQWWTPPQRRVPPLLWVRISNDLSKYLITRGSDGCTVYAWYHRIWGEAVRDLYLSDPKFKFQVHRALADYFSGKWKNGKPHKVLKNGVEEEKIIDRLVDPQEIYLADDIPNVRKLSELPYHQIHCKDHTEMADLSLGYFPFIGAKIEAGKLFELLEDYILEQATHAEGEENKELQDYLKFIRNGVHLLALDPSALLQLGMNCPDNTLIYKEAEETIAKYKPNRAFVKWLNKSQHPDPCHVTVLLDIGERVKIALSNDRTKIAAVGQTEEKCMLQVFNLQTGANLLKAEVKSWYSHQIAFSTDALLVYDATSYGIDIFDIATGNIKHVDFVDFPYAGDIVVLALSPLGQMVVGLSFLIENSSEGLQYSNLLYTFEGGFGKACKRKDKIFSCEFISESTIVFAFNESFGIWNLKTDALTECAVEIRDNEYQYAWAVCTQYVAILQKNRISLWDIATGSKLWSIENEQYDFHTGLFSMDNQTLLVCDGITLKSIGVDGKAELIATVVDSMPDISHLYWGQDNKLILTYIDPMAHYTKRSLCYCKVWDLSIPPLQRLGKATEFLKNGELVALHPTKKSIRIFSTSELAEISSFNIPFACKRIHTSPIALDSDSLIVIPTNEFGFEIQNLSTKEVKCKYADGEFLCFSPDGKKICFSPNGSNDSNMFPKEHEHAKRLIVLYLDETKGLSIPLCGFTFAFRPMQALAAAFSNNSEFLFYASNQGVQLLELNTSKSHTVVNYTTMEYVGKIQHGSFSFDDLFLGLASENETIIYDVQQKDITTVIDVGSYWVIFDPHNSDIVILGSRKGLEVMWWTRMGQLLHIFYLLDIPQYVSVKALQSSYQLMVTDRSRYSYIIVPLHAQRDIHKLSKLAISKSNIVSLFKEQQVQQNMPLSLKEVQQWASRLECDRGSEHYNTTKYDFLESWSRQYMLPQYGILAMTWSFADNREIKLGPALPISIMEEQSKKIADMEQFITDFADALVTCCKAHNEDENVLNAKLEELKDEYFAKALASNHFGCEISLPMP